MSENLYCKDLRVPSLKYRKNYDKIFRKRVVKKCINDCSDCEYFYKNKNSLICKLTAYKLHY